MSIGISNADNSYFNVKTKLWGNKSIPQTIASDVISFSVTEEINKMISGNIRLYDNNDVYSRVLRFGLGIECEWGYTNADTSIQSILGLKRNPTEIKSGTYSRSGLKGTIQAPGGSGDNSGVKVFDCNFFGSEIMSGGDIKKRSGTKASIVRQVLSEMGCSDTKVDFLRGNDIITAPREIMQRESHFKFLTNLARQWDCIFRIGYNKSGKMIGLFTELKKQSVIKTFCESISGGFGDSIYLEYKEGVCNVKEFTWKQNLGSGDNIQLTYGADGKPQFIRYQAENEKVVAYRFNPDAVSAALKKEINKSIGSGFSLLREMLSTTDFQTLVKKGYFIKVIDQTAQQGYGYTLNVKMIGNPFCTAGLPVRFGKGFPAMFNQKNLILYVQKVTHSVSSVYEMQLDIVDGLTLNGGSYVG